MYGGLRVVLFLSLTSTYSAYGRNNKRVAVLYIDTLFPRWTGVHEVMLSDERLVYEWLMIECARCLYSAKPTWRHQRGLIG